MSESVNRRGPPPFDLPVVEDGYRWWYLDAVSDDGQHALVIIAFVGSVFSPYYYAARQRGAGRPDNFCAINVAVYGPGGRWCMTERRAGSVRRSRDRFNVGPSRVHWDGSRLVYDVRERCAPFGQALTGRVVAEPASPCALDVTLDPNGRHRWTPWSPHGKVTVELEHPGLSWRGGAYLDANAGDEPLERAFRSWDWSRTEEDGRTRLHYALRPREGAERLLCYEVDPQGGFVEGTGAPVQAQGLTGWGLRGAPRADHDLHVAQRMEDTPFYSRTLYRGGGGVTVHEHLDLARFTSPWVRLLLPFRMPREWRSRPAGDASG